MSLPSARGWGPGWPNPETNKIVKLNLPGFGNAQRVRHEIAPLVEWLITETERRGYHIRPEWTWGFNNRPVRGTENRPNPVPSDHSWATALDLNAPTNGMNRSGRGWAAQHAAGRTDMPEWLPELWKAYGFDWGGDFANRQDPMHMQFGGTPADAATYTAKIGQPPEDIDMTPEQEAKIDRLLASNARLEAALNPDNKGNLLVRIRDSVAKQESRSAEIVKGIRSLLGKG